MRKRIRWRSIGRSMPTQRAEQCGRNRPNASRTRKAPSATRTAGGLWEVPGERNDAKKQPASDDAAAESRQSKDPTGQSGTKLDLTG